MKRNMDLIREILSFIEDKCNGIGFVSLDPQYFQESDWNVIQQHARLVTERGLAKARLLDSQGYCFQCLTWDGHDFLDNARNSTVWSAAIKAAGSLSFGVFQEVLKASAIEYALAALKRTF